MAEHSEPRSSSDNKTGAEFGRRETEREQVLEATKPRRASKFLHGMTM